MGKEEMNQRKMASYVHKHCCVSALSLLDDPALSTSTSEPKHPPQVFTVHHNISLQLNAKTQSLWAAPVTGHVAQGMEPTNCMQDAFIPPPLRLGTPTALLN